MREPHFNASLSIEEHLMWAERHAQMALDKCYEVEGTTRSYFFRTALGRAQSILMNLRVKEERNHT